MKTAEDTGRVHGTREGAVGTIVFENRRRLNALSSDMAAEARELLASYASDPAVRVVVMRGEGEKAFISGGDISKFEATRFHPPRPTAHEATRSCFSRNWRHWRSR